MQLSCLCVDVNLNNVGKTIKLINTPSQLAFPTHWQVAKMILLPKSKTNVVNINETRPISLLPCFSKLYEKVFLIYFHKWVKESGLLP